MQQIEQKRAENQALARPISEASKVSLASLTMRMGDSRMFRDNAHLALRLGEMGDPEAVRAELHAIITGPVKATVRDFAGQLGKLSLHYWRPDFTPEQAKAMYGDFVHDLAAVTAPELIGACQEWRIDPLNRFFPTPGQLLELVRSAISRRAVQSNGAQYLLALLENPGVEGHDDREISEKISALADKMRSASVARESRFNVEMPRHTVPTARSETDAAELTATLARRSDAA